MLIDIADGQVNMTNRHTKAEIYHHYGNLHEKSERAKSIKLPRRNFEKMLVNWLRK